MSSWLANQQRFHAGVLPAGGDAADDVGGGFRLALALFHPHHNGDGRRLVGDGIEAARQGALLPGPTGGGEHVGEQHGLVQREGGRIGIAGRQTMPTMAVETVRMGRVPSLISRTRTP